MLIEAIFPTSVWIVGPTDISTQFNETSGLPVNRPKRRVLQKLDEGIDDSGFYSIIWIEGTSKPLFSSLTF
jgi:hypothetical protein